MRSLSAQDLLDLAPHVFDGVEVGGIGRQLERPRACGFEGLADSPDFVSCQIVHDHQVPLLQGGGQPLPDPGQKHLAVHGTRKQPRGARTLQAHAGDQRAGLLVSVRDARQQSSSCQGPAAPACHFRIGPAFIHKYQPTHRLRSQMFMPAGSFSAASGRFCSAANRVFFISPTQLPQP